MKRFFEKLFTVVVLAVFVFAGTPEIFAETLRVASYNLKRYSGSAYGTNVGGGTRPKPADECSAVRDVILEVRPDIIAVQEIGDEEWLDKLADDLEKAENGIAFPHRILLRGSDRFNRLAVLSRLPFKQKIIIPAPAQILTRGLLGVEVAVGNGEKAFRLYNIHLKSKISNNKDDPDSNLRREREARCVRSLIETRVADRSEAKRKVFSMVGKAEKLPAGSPVELFAIVGDFNDLPHSKQLESIEDENFAKILPAKAKNPPSEGAGTEFFTYFHPRSYTNAAYLKYRGTYDRILVSPSLYKNHYVPESAKIANVPAAKKASDHRLIYADFEF